MYRVILTGEGTSRPLTGNKLHPSCKQGLRTLEERHVAAHCKDTDVNFCGVAATKGVRVLLFDFVKTHLSLKFCSGVAPIERPDLEWNKLLADSSVWRDRGGPANAIHFLVPPNLIGHSYVHRNKVTTEEKTVTDHKRLCEDGDVLATRAELASGFSKDFVASSAGSTTSRRESACLQRRKSRRRSGLSGHSRERS